MIGQEKKKRFSHVKTCQTWYIMQKTGVVDGDQQGPHTCSAITITPRQTLQWEKENENRFVTQVLCFHRSYVSMCKNSPLPQSVAHKHSSKTFTHPCTPTPFKGCLLGSLASLWEG